MSDKKLKIGVTGGISSGKSTVCQIFQSKKYPVFFADKIAKEILVTDEIIRQKVIDAFGQESYTGSNLNKSFLAKTIFPDPFKVSQMNSIVHPATIRSINQKVSASLKDSPIVFVEAPLLFEAEMEKYFDYVLLVSSPLEQRIRRTETRDAISRNEVLDRIKNQTPEDINRGKADFVLENNSTLADLEKKAEFFIHLFELMIKPI